MAVPELVASLLTVAREDFDALRGMENNDLFADEIF